MNDRSLLIPFLRDISNKLKKRFFFLVILNSIVAITDGLRLLAVFLLLPFIGIPIGHQNQGILYKAQTIFETFGIAYTIGPVVIIIILVFLIQAILAILQSWYQGAYSFYYTMIWRKCLFKAINQAQWQYFVNTSRGEIVNILSQETARLSDSIKKALTFFSGLLVSISYIVLSFMISPKISLLLLSAGIIILIVNTFVIKYLIQHAQAIIKGNIQMMDVIQNFLNNIKILKIYPQEFSVDRLVAQPLNTIYNNERIGFILPNASRIAAELLIMSTLVGSIIITIVLEINIATSNMLIVFVLFMRTYTKLTGCMTLAQQMYVHLPSFQSIKNFYHKVTAKEESRWNDGKELKARNLNKGISFENISVLYNERPALFEINARLSSNSLIAIVGASGAGKTTFIDTILRLTDPHSGKLTVSGIDASDFNLQSWRKNFGYVSQEQVLFNGSLSDNIKLFKPEATKEDIRHAAKLACAQDFIELLPEGYDTQVGEHGLKLSGGQRQRIAIARALINPSPIIIFDEATNALDSETEKKVMETFYKMREIKTIIIITHRLSTIQNADNILILDKGKLVEHGSWHELLGNKGRFNELCEQLSETINISNYVSDS